MIVIENKSPENIDLRWNKNRTVVMVDGWLIFNIDKDSKIVTEAQALKQIQVESTAYFWNDYIHQVDRLLKPIGGIEYAIFCLAEDWSLNLSLETV